LVCTLWLTENPWPCPSSVTNAYNLLPSSSPLRPTTLLTLISLLSADLLPSLSLSINQIEQYLFEWSLSDEARIQWLADLAALYENAVSASAAPSSATTTQLKEKALELRVLGLTVAAHKGLGVDSKNVEKTVGAALAVPARFDLSPILSIKGVRDSLQGDVKELVALLEGEGESGADFKKAAAWIQGKSSWLESIGELCRVNGGVLSFLWLT
jgi:translation initiation factor 3 subunit M